MTRIGAIAILTTVVASVHAQEPARAPQSAQFHRRAAVEKAMQGELRAAVEARTAIGAPYSAEATTEFTQVLADGNRIVRKSVTRIYRDSDGRTRREPVLDSAGSRDGESITISDPTGGASVVLDPGTRTAYKSHVVLALKPSATRAKVEAGRTEEALAPAGVARMRMPAPEPVLGSKIRVAQATIPGGDTRHEDLGTQIIEGVPAEGTRTTTVIPAGAIGNEQPITIVSEQWFSPDLQVLVLTRHSDPRAGETVYRVTNIVRAEPDRALFEVPADYTVKDISKRKLMPVRPGQ